MDTIKNIFAQIFSERNMKMLEKMGKQTFQFAKEKSTVLIQEAKKIAEQKSKEMGKKADGVKKEVTKKVTEAKIEPTKEAKKKD